MMNYMDQVGSTPLVDSQIENVPAPVAPKQRKPPIIIIVMMTIVVLVVFVLAALVFRNTTSPSLVMNKFLTQPSPTNNPTSTPTPLILGNLLLSVLDSFTQKPMANITVTIKGTQEYSGTTDQLGNLTMKDIPVGSYSVYNNDQINNIQVTEATVSANIDTKMSVVSQLVNPLPSKISGYVFEDKNGNGIKDAGEKGMGGVVSVYRFTGVNQTVMEKSIITGVDGYYTHVARGQARYFIFGEQITFYSSPMESYKFTPLGDGASFQHNFAYKPQVSTSGGFKIFVYNDKNENLKRDSDEELIAYQHATIRNTTTGKTWNLAIPPEGATESYLETAHYYIHLEPENAGWESNYKRLQDAGDVDVSPSSGMTELYLGVHKLQ